jgi:hypothetical protein
MMLRKFHYYWLTTVLSIGTIGFGTVWVLAQPPTRSTEVTILEGKVTELTRNDHNDPDGWKLDNGQFVHVPPHAFADLNAQVKAGALVKASTVKKPRPDGTTVNEALVVEVDDRRIAILPPVPPTTPKKPHSEEKPMKAKGKIVSFHENKHGDVDGFMLSDDTTVKFPPHMGESLGKELKIGTEVSVNGKRHETPKGDIHLHADDITAEGYVYTIDAPKPPKHGPQHGPGQEDWMTKKQADEMLSELREIRKLMEEKAK